MQPNINDIFDFYKKRMICHVQTVNYFASLLGYKFPEHDGDKFCEPMSNHYMYILYNIYHKNFHILPEHVALFKRAKYEHHKNAPHHIEHYNNVADIPDIYLYEIISDCAATNFEFLTIIKQLNSLPLREWFNENMLHLPWTAKQLKIIHTSLDFVLENTDSDYVKTIWQPILEKIDL